MRHFAFLSALAAFALVQPVSALADDDKRHVSKSSVTQEQAVRIARGYGMVRVTEVERDDEGWEIEGYDHRGRELQVKIDWRGRVTSVERDDD